MKILFTGGGSYGHVSPIVSIFSKLKNGGVFTEFYWIGSTSFEEKAAKDLGISYIQMKTAKVRRYMSWKNVTDMFVLFKSLFQTFSTLRTLRPDVIFSTGGYVSVPVVLIGKLLGIKIAIHEQTVSFGLANKVGAYVAHSILLSDEGSLAYISKQKRKISHVVGNPVQEKLFVPAKIEEYFTFLNPSKKVMYITGGSQGSQKINEVIFETLAELVGKYNIIHQCGVLDYEKAKEYMKIYEGSYIARDFIGDQMPAIYQHANIVITRAGANTVNELDAFSIPAIFIPLQPCNNDEQYKNAVKFLITNKGVIIRQDKLSKELLLEAVEALHIEPSSLVRVIKGNSAAVEIVKILEGLVG